MTLIIIINRVFCAPFPTIHMLDNLLHIHHGKNATMNGYDDVHANGCYVRHDYVQAHIRSACVPLASRDIEINASFRIHTHFTIQWK